MSVVPNKQDQLMITTHMVWSRWYYPYATIFDYLSYFSELLCGLRSLQQLALEVFRLVSPQSADPREGLLAALALRRLFVSVVVVSVVFLTASTLFCFAAASSLSVSVVFSMYIYILRYACKSFRSFWVKILLANIGQICLRKDDDLVGGLVAHMYIP